MTVYQVCNLKWGKYSTTDCRDLLSSILSDSCINNSSLELTICTDYYVEDREVDSSGNYYLDLSVYNGLCDSNRTGTVGTTSDWRVDPTININDSIRVNELLLKDCIVVLGLEDMVEYEYDNGRFVLLIKRGFKIPPIMLLTTVLLVCSYVNDKKSFSEVLSIGVDELTKINRNIPPYVYAPTRIEAIFIADLIRQGVIEKSLFSDMVYRGLTRTIQFFCVKNPAQFKKIYNVYKDKSSMWFENGSLSRSSMECFFDFPFN